MMGYPTNGYRAVYAPPGALLTAGVRFSMPEAVTARLVAVTFRLVTDATAGNRSTFVSLHDGSGQAVARSVAGFAQTPSSTADYSFACDDTEWDSDLLTVASGPLFSVPVDVGDTINILGKNAGAADALSLVRMVFWQVDAYPGAPD